MKLAHKILLQSNLHDSYWGLRIISAEKRGYWTKKDKDLSVQWITESMTCLIAQRDPCIRRIIIGFDSWVTIDEEFDEYPANEDWSCFFLAAEDLINIEERSELLFGESLK